MYIYSYYKQSTITYPYQLFHLLEGTSGGPYSNKLGPPDDSSKG